MPVPKLSDLQQQVRVLRDEDVGSVASWNWECCETDIIRWVYDAPGDVSAMLTQIDRYKEQLRIDQVPEACDDAVRGTRWH